jgi:RyR domain
MPANIRDDAFVERLARSIHHEYVVKSQARGETNPSAVPWGELPDDLRQANVAQAAAIGAKLEAINAVVVPRSAAGPAFRFTDKEIEDLAELEHERWMRERIGQGWRYGEERDNRRRIHPSLVDWAVLPEAERKKDRDSVLAIPGILRDAGYQIRRLPSP